MKRTTFKRAAALLLALVLICALLPQAAPAARAASNSGQCGEELTWRFDSRSGKLTISGEGNMWDFWGDIDRGDGSDNGVPWIAFLDQITALELPEGLTSVGDNAFMNCLHLKAAVIPENVTRIGWCAFNACADLSEIVLSEGITEIGAYAFSSCAGLTEVVLPSRLEYLEEETFSFCVGLTALTFLNPCCSISEDCLANSGEPTVYGHNGSTAELFAEEQGFPFVSLGDFTAEGVCGDNLTWSLNSGTGVLTLFGEGDMWSFTGFRGDGYLSCNTEPWRAWRGIITGLDLPEGLTSIGDAGFNGCWKLESVVIPETVTRIGDYAFGACNDLSELVIPEGVTSIGESAFNFCESLPELVLPASVELVDSWAFAFCFSLNDITFLNPTCVIADDCLDCTENAAVHGYSGSTAESFAAAQGLRFIPLDNPPTEGVCGDDLTWSFDPETGVLTIEGTGAMYDFLDYSESTESPTLYAPWLDLRGAITSVSLPEGLTYIGAGAFFSCQELTEAALPETLTEIGESAFCLCYKLRTVSLHEGLERIGEAAFMQCYSLVSVAFPESLSYLGPNAFNSCSSLTELRFPANLVSLGYHPFLYCHSLSAVTVAEENPAFSSENGVLFDKEKETLILYPAARSGAYSIPNGVTYIEENAFAFCHGLTDVGIPDSVTSLGSRAFEACTGLRSITLPNSVWYIGSGAFLGCSGLTGFEIPDGVTRISPSTFYNCSNLRSVSIPASIRSIGYDAFEGCVNLTDVTIPYGVTTIGNYAFGGCTGLRSLFIPQSVTAFQGELFTRDVSATIYGFAGSRAEAYAASKNIPFVALTAADLFSDVDNDSWYADAVLWAARFGITSGTGNGKFSPKQACTREQIVTFIWKANGSEELYGLSVPFTDVVPGKYYEPAVIWAYHHDPQITGGMNETTFGVGKPCTRAQVVTFLYAAAGKPEPMTTENPFTDVKETDYFYKAVLWAAENGVTSGTTPTTFSPKQTCTRAQVVTFLYKADAIPVG